MVMTMKKKTETKPKPATEKRPDLTTLAKKINASHQKAREAEWSGLPEVIETGRLLSEAKQGVGHGEWGPWVTKNCEFTIREAQRYLFVAKNEDKIAKLEASEKKLSLRDCIAQLSEQLRNKKSKKKVPPLPFTLTKEDLDDAEDAKYKPTWDSDSPEQAYIEKKADTIGRDLIRLVKKSIKGTSEPPTDPALMIVALFDELKAQTLARVVEAAASSEDSKSE